MGSVSNIIMRTKFKLTDEDCKEIVLESMKKQKPSALFEGKKTFGEILESIKHIGSIVDGTLVCTPDCPHPSHTDSTRGEGILSVEDAVEVILTFAYEFVKEVPHDLDLLRRRVTPLFTSRDAYWEKQQQYMYETLDKAYADALELETKRILKEKVERDVLKGARRRVIEEIRAHERGKLIGKIAGLPTRVMLDEEDEPTDYKRWDDIMKVI